MRRVRRAVVRCEDGPRGALARGGAARAGRRRAADAAAPPARLRRPRRGAAAARRAGRRRRRPPAGPARSARRARSTCLWTPPRSVGSRGCSASTATCASGGATRTPGGSTGCGPPASRTSPATAGCRSGGATRRAGRASRRTRRSAFRTTTTSCRRRSPHACSTERSSDELSRLPARRVAGRSAAGLRLVPADPASTIARVDVWADEASGLPLRVEVYGEDDTAHPDPHQRDRPASTSVTPRTARSASVSHRA